MVIAYQSSLPRSNSQRSGRYSDPGTWDVPPTRDRAAVLRHAVTLDQGEAGFVGIEAGAVATLAGTLHSYGSVVVYGTLAGSVGELHFHVPDDRAMVGNTRPGPNPADRDDHHGTDPGLWTMGGGSCLLRGPEVTPWVEAVSEGAGFRALPYGGQAFAAVRNGRAYLPRSPVGWRTGDTLLLCSPTGVYALATLTAIIETVAAVIPTTDTEIRFSGADTFEAEVVTVEGRTVLPRVANLSRRLVIASADVREGDTNHRAHTLFNHHAHVHLDYVEFRDLGPRAKLGRYPVHFHHFHAAHHGGGLVGCSIWQSTREAGSRFVTIHGAQGLTVRNNVGLRSQGHGFFMEDGTETGNTVSGNLAVDVRGPEELDVKDEGASPGSHGFWLRAGNVISGNVVVNPPSSTLQGMMADPDGPQGLSQIVPAKTGMTVIAHRVIGVPHAIQVIEDFVCLGPSEYGLWSAGHPVRFVRPVIAFAGVAAVGSDQFQYNTLPPGIVLENPTLLYNGDALTTQSWGSAIFADKQRSPLEVLGGLIVGKKAVHLHYSAKLAFRGTVFRVETLLDPTYWECGVLFDQCDIQAQYLFKQLYPKHMVGPGLVRFRGCLGSHFQASPDADYVGRWDEEAFRLTGTPIKNQFGLAVGIKLASPLPPAGFIALPAAYRPSYSKWSVTPSGVLSREFTLLENQGMWEGLRSVSGGYPHGIPPGTYIVKARIGTAEPKTWNDVVVTAGQVTTLT